MKKKLLEHSLFLFLLPAFFLMHNYNELFGFLDMKQIVNYAIFIYLLLIVCFLLLSAITRSTIRSSLIIFIFLLFILFFGPIHTLLKIVFGHHFLSSYKVVLPISFFLLLWLSWKIIRAKSNPMKLVRWVNLTMISLVCWEIVSGTINYNKWKRTGNLIYPGKPICNQYSANRAADSLKPDIYFLVFDEYTNNKTLEDLWHFKNNEITNWLEQQGFFIAYHSRANYPCTFFSLSSVFNMDYLDPMLGTDATKARNILLGNQSLSDNETFCTLRKEGYSIHFLAPFSNSIGENGLGHYFDFLINDQLWMQTLPGNFEADIGWEFFTKGQVREVKRNSLRHLQLKAETNGRIIQEIKEISDHTGRAEPQFTYGHFMIAHEPNVFDSSGRFAPQQQNSSGPEIFRTYTTEIIYANKVMRELVSNIFEKNKRAIIIIAGDHGYKEFNSDKMKSYAYPNFFAAYFPDKNYSDLSDQMTPVNTFRIIFNKFFNQNLSLLKDSLVEVKLN